MWHGEWMTERCVILLSQLQSASHIIRLGGGRGRGVGGEGRGGEMADDDKRAKGIAEILHMHPPSPPTPQPSGTYAFLTSKKLEDSQ